MDISKLNPLRPITQGKMHTGTKFIILNFITTMIVVVFVAVVLPILSIWFPIMVEVIAKLNPAAVLTALLGQSGVATAANMIRLAIENRASKQANPKQPLNE